MIDEQTDEALSAWIDDELPELDRRRLERRMQAEPHLRVRLEELQAASAALRAFGPRKAPPEFHAAVMAATGESTARSGLRGLPVGAMALAATALFAVLALPARDAASPSPAASPMVAAPAAPPSTEAFPAASPPAPSGGAGSPLGEVASSGRGLGGPGYGAGGGGAAGARLVPEAPTANLKAPRGVARALDVDVDQAALRAAVEGLGGRLLPAAESGVRCVDLPVGQFAALTSRVGSTAKASDVGDPACGAPAGGFDRIAVRPRTKLISP